jgi:hypothetical protein
MPWDWPNKNSSSIFVPPFEMMRKLTLCVTVLLCGHLNAQQVILPEGEAWKVTQEGTELAFRLGTDTAGARFSIEGLAALGPGVVFDTLGYFAWTPSFDLVDRLERQKEVSIIFEAEWKNGMRARSAVTFLVTHQNRPPVIEDLPIWYARQSVQSRYRILSDYAMDPDGDPLIFKSVASTLPEGAHVASTGLVSWTLSRNQFASLNTSPVYIDFIAQDPDKAETRGRIRVAQTQLDLPPELLMVPGDTVFSIKEDERLFIRLYVTDPNGDDNISSVAFVCGDERVPMTSLKRNSPSQSEFTWTPGYAFVDESQKQVKVEITFFALDKSSNRVVRQVAVNVRNAENLDEKDKLNFMKYRASLVQARALIIQLDKNHEALTKAYKKAKKGKKQRALLNAGLGAATGMSPLMADDASKYVSVVGGTTVLTMGTLEATEIIGKSKNDILDKMKINVEIRNQLQIEGDNFARKYALKSSRRSREFNTDREKLLPIINNQKLVVLELDASKSSMPKYSDQEIKSTFPDFGLE